MSLIVRVGIYFSQTSVIYFCRGFSCCPYYRGVRDSEVSSRRDLTLLGRRSVIGIPDGCESFFLRDTPVSFHFNPSTKSVITIYKLLDESLNFIFFFGSLW